MKRTIYFMFNKQIFFYFAILTILVLMGFCKNSFGQACDSITPSLIVDLTGNPDSVWTSPNISRAGYCCSASGSDNCIEFIITIDANSEGIRLDIISGAIPPGALFFEVNCANPTEVGDTLCLSGTGPHRITFCKPGNNANVYSITAINDPKVSDAIVVSEGCIDTLFAYGFDETTIQWTSVPFNAVYNSYLSCTTGCDSTIVTAQPGFPPFVDYQVCGVANGACSNDTICDTIRAYFVTDLVGQIFPSAPFVCTGGATITLTALMTGGAPPYSFLWNNGDTTQSINVGAGIYSVKMSDSTDCFVVSDTVVVLDNPPPLANFDYTGACLGDTMLFNDSSSVLSGSIISWSWDFGDGFGDTISNPTHVFDSAGIYTVQLVVTSDVQCTDTIVKKVTVNDVIADFSFVGHCLNQGVSFLDSSTIVISGSVISWLWSFGDGGLDTIKEPVHIYNTPGGYIVTLVVESSMGCVDTVTKPINIDPSFLTADFVTDQTIVSPFDIIQFTDLSDNAITWFWNFGDASGNSSQQNPSYNYSDTGIYAVLLVVSDQFGCTDSTFRNIIVQLPPKVPNAFSPNGDGENDVLYVKGGPFVKLEFNIYNEWGELIFASDKQERGWDGTKDGVPQPIGVYAYTLTATTADYITYNETGDITLLR